MTYREWLISLLLVFVCIPVLAKPAPWYQWRSKVDGKIVCAQASPGKGWRQARGPYRDAHCEQAGKR